MKKIKLFLLFSFLLTVSCKPEQAKPPQPSASHLEEKMGCEALQNIQGVWMEEGTGAVIGFCWDFDTNLPSNTLTVSIKKKNPSAIYALEAGVYTVGKVRIGSDKKYYIVSLYEPYPEFGGVLGHAGALTFDLIDVDTIHISAGEAVCWKRIKPAVPSQKQ